MEFDNDRPVKRRPYKIEIFYWIFLGLINPLVNCYYVFYNDARMWVVLFIISLALLPAYLFYSSSVVPKFLFQNRHLLFILSSIGIIIVLHAFLFGIYSIVLEFSLSPYESAYFTYTTSTIVRENLWMLINMSLAVGIYFIKTALDEKDLVATLEKDNTSFKLKYMRSQLNPHFLFNTLNSIYSLSLQKSDKTPEMVVKLADLMRYMIYDCTEDKVPLDKEIEFIRNYIEIEKIRHNADVRFAVEGSTEGVMIEPFLFISFIENGFKHAFDTSYSGAFIYITLKAEPQQIALTVVNNTSIDLETQAKRIQGTSMMNSKSVLEMLYPKSHALDIIQTDKEDERKNELRFKHARQRLEALYPDSHTLDVILSQNAFTVSLIINKKPLDKVHYS